MHRQIRIRFFRGWLLGMRNLKFTYWILCIKLNYTSGILLVLREVRYEPHSPNSQIKPFIGEDLNSYKTILIGTSWNSRKLLITVEELSKLYPLSDCMSLFDGSMPKRFKTFSSCSSLLHVTCVSTQRGGLTRSVIKLVQLPT